MSETIDQLLRDLVSKEASDLHLKSGKAPVMRINVATIRGYESAPASTTASRGSAT